MYLWKKSVSAELLSERTSATDIEKEEFRFLNRHIENNQRLPFDGSLRHSSCEGVGEKAFEIEWNILKVRRNRGLLRRRSDECAVRNSWWHRRNRTRRSKGSIWENALRLQTFEIIFFLRASARSQEFYRFNISKEKKIDANAFDFSSSSSIKGGFRNL